MTDEWPTRSQVTHGNYSYVVGTTGAVTVGASATRFPSAGSTEAVVEHIKAGEITGFMVHNTGTVNPAYVAIDEDADTDSPLMVPPNSWRHFDVRVSDYVSICSTDATYTTTVRVAFYGE